MKKALYFAAGAAAATLGVSLAVYLKAFYNKNAADVTYDVLTGEDYDPYHDKMISLIDEANAIPYEAVYTESYDGLKLFGRLYMQKEDAPLYIQFNGYRGNGIRDFSGGLKLALSYGHNVIVVDQRAHGRSEGHTITFGVKERRDVLSWVDYAIKRFGKDVRICIAGISMGAATVLMASDLPLPENVRGIVADSPYSSPFGIVAKVAKEMTHIDYVTYPFIYLGARLFGRFDILSSSALKSVKNAKVPIFIAHGTGDHFVPVEMSRAIKEANPDKVTLFEVEGAPHGLSFVKDYDAYKREFTRFIEKISM
ncbi:MAG: alpha/beta fold hydrolase [Clostridia bacterium]|nr:alpha/beta fold hydrolase [Clostridia bacterium]